MPPTADDFAAVAALEGVPSALAAARDGIDVLLRDRGLRRTTPELTAESLLRGAAASAALDGSGSSLADLRSGDGDLVAAGAARLNAGLLALVPVLRRSPLQVFARLHTLAAGGAVEDAALGRPRAESGLDARLHRLARQLVAPTEAPAIAVAALAHAEIAALAPFKSANGLVARALERLILVERGVDPTSVTVPEGGHLALADGYRDALAAYRRGDLDGRRAWLFHAATAVTQGAELSPLR